MSRLETAIVSYAHYHRDPRNIAYHSAGIPTIVFAVLVLTSRFAFPVGPLTLTPALVLVAAATVFYLSLDLVLGLAMLGALAALVPLAGAAASLEQVAWLAIGVGCFAGGWVLQVVGHGYEGRKPAFLDDLVSLAVGPLFVMWSSSFASARSGRYTRASCVKPGPSPLGAPRVRPGVETLRAPGTKDVTPSPAGTLFC